ncbi:hypothetical protein AJ78_08466 [Emergomyces pasteurianus Ep9510]|uniref:Hydrophobin n=1 Tax=Emergomyces pasteurianus Ep9510 TaxID=1447872 RepID=A0A1J9PRS4_9EURO|nr:hypothetical protein AJ78_08466 [Emergomyces pasteurianus Ep9510]
MRSLLTLLPNLLLLFTLHITPSAADSCIKTNDVSICCPGSLLGGLTTNNDGKPVPHGVCCIDRSTVKRRGIDASGAINIINHDILPLNRRQGKVDFGASRCGEDQILVPLSATDYQKRVSSIMASITGDGSSSVKPTTNTTPLTTQNSNPTTTETPPSNAGMPAATGQGSYIAAIGGALAAAVLVAGAL